MATKKPLTSTDHISGNDIGIAWSETAVDVGPGQVAHLLVNGVELSVSVVGCCSAAWKTAMYAATGTKAILTLNIMEGGKTLVAGWTAGVAILDAVRAEVEPLVYVGCIVLGKAKSKGLTRNEFRAEVEAFFARVANKKLPWYTGLTKPYLKNAIEAIKVQGWFDDMVSKMDKAQWLIQEKGRLKFRDRHVVFKRLPVT